VQLRDYIRIITKRAWIIILAAFLAAASALVFSRLQIPVYRSTIYLDVWPARLDWGLQQTIKGLLRNYAGQIRSAVNLAKVIDRLQLDITTEELQAKVTVSPIEADFLIQIDANDHDPITARDIAQETAQVFVEDIHAYMLDQDKSDRVRVTIRDAAEVGILYKPKWKINTLAGGVFGVLVGGLVVFVLEWLQADIVRSSEDVERHMGLAVLGAIPVVTLSSGERRHHHRQGQGLAQTHESSTGGMSHGR
jgi:capsular polysaccharide biosynthesis protein